MIIDKSEGFRPTYRFTEEEKPVKEEKKEPKITVKRTTTRLRVRKEPNGEILKILDSGAPVEVVEVKNGWARLVDGNYVMNKFLK